MAHFDGYGRCGCDIITNHWYTEEEYEKLEEKRMNNKIERLLEIIDSNIQGYEYDLERQLSNDTRKWVEGALDEARRIRYQLLDVMGK